MMLSSRTWAAALCLAVLGLAGCASLPPGSDYPKTASTALAHPDTTRLGHQFEAAAAAHGGRSGFRLLSAGVDGFLARAQMMDAAERTLDLEYYIFRQDETGQLLADALLRAADRGVRVRVLVDDGDTVPGDERIAALAEHPNIEVRVFNPFAYRGHAEVFRAVEFLFNASRLDYRMHNKLMVVDNSIALVGGRNIGDQYFQVDPDSQFGDDDVFAAGPIARELSVTFDDFWNSDMAIPAAALETSRHPFTTLDDFRKALDDHRRQLNAEGVEYARRVATGQPLGGMLSGRLPLVWTTAQVVCDSPDKARVENGEMVGSLMHPAVARAVADVQTELLMVTPFLIPGKDGMRLFARLHDHGATVRILTNSLESNPEPEAHSGYMHYRLPLLEDGVQLYEIRSLIGNARGSGESPALAQEGNYALHAKLFVFDRRQLYVGSMNFDERSHRLNTEIGLLIDSPELARETAARFDAIVIPANTYALGLRPNPWGGPPGLVWRTREDGKDIGYDTEPARSDWQRLKVQLLSLLPLDREL